MPGQLPIRRADFPDDLFIKEFEIVTKECGLQKTKLMKAKSYKQC